ncbi:MAG: DUF120 domain-containing protein [Halobacteriaceae archaeon]
MDGQLRSVDVGNDEIAALKLLALEGARHEDRLISCSDLADRLDASTQTASRRLQALDRAGYLTREQTGDGQWVTITDAGDRVLKAEYEAYRRIFEHEDVTVLSGTVTTGMGEGRHYISLEGYMDQFRDRLHYEPFPGTLNVALATESQRRRAALETVDGTRIDEWEGEDRTYGAATCYPATVETDDRRYSPAHVIVPDRTHHDESHLELIAPVKLRDELGLSDGDRIDIHAGLE